MRVLFASTHGTRHFGPLIPLIDSCRRNGHETLVVGASDARALDQVADLPVRVLLSTGATTSSSARCRTTCESSGGSTSRRSRDVAAAQAGVVATIEGIGHGRLLELVARGG